MPFDNAMLADVDPVLEAEQIGHLPLGALAKTHSGLQTLHVLPWASLGLGFFSRLLLTDPTQIFFVLTVFW